MPAFESNDGKYLTDSNAIAYYVANQELRGKKDFEQAQVLQWLGFAETEILPAACAWVFPVLGIIQYNKQVGGLLFVRCSHKGRLNVISNSVCNEERYNNF